MEIRQDPAQPGVGGVEGEVPPPNSALNLPNGVRRSVGMDLPATGLESRGQIGAGSNTRSRWTRAGRRGSEGGDRREDNRTGGPTSPGQEEHRSNHYCLLEPCMNALDL